ncbi:hypothetical protein, partial [Helicobacter burdigaliensis]|uniref:hypothetical protein n=1 Tax=Helicobacter burdigaliensis TaxID=2315334 RepID=UPI0013009FB0
MQTLTNLFTTPLLVRGGGANSLSLLTPSLSQNLNNPLTFPLSLRRSFASEAIYSLLSLQEAKQSANPKRVIKKFKQFHFILLNNESTLYIKSILRVAWEEFACQIQGSHRHE